MKIVINLDDYEELIVNLLKTYSFHVNNIISNDYYYWKMIYQFIINSTLYNNQKNKIILALKFHFDGNYDKCYETLMNNTEVSNLFYDKIVNLLIEIEYLEFLKNFTNFFIFFENDYFPTLDVNKNFETDESRNIDKIFSKQRSYFKNRRGRIIKFFNIDINSLMKRVDMMIESFDLSSESGITNLNKEKHIIYKQIIDILEDSQVLTFLSLKGKNEVYSDTNLNISNHFKFAFLNFLKNLQMTQETVNFFEQNVFQFSSYNSHKRHNHSISFYRNKTNSSYYYDKYTESGSENKNEDEYENEKLNEKLNSIEESLNTINFEHKVSNRGITLHQIYNTDKSGNSTNCADYSDFKLKLKLFDLLKSFVKRRKRNKVSKVKIKGKEKMADIFYQNLIKSRSFFGLLKWIKSLKYSDIMKQHYLEYRINYFSKFIIKGFVYVFNRKKLVDAFIDYKNKKSMKNMLEVLASDTKFKINHRKLYLSQLMNNHYATKFLLNICEFVKKKNFNIRMRTNLNSNYLKLKLISDYYTKRKIFDILANNKAKFKEFNAQLLLVADTLKKKFHENSLKEFFVQSKTFNKTKFFAKKYLSKLFLLRYYFWKYKNEVKITKLESSKDKLRLYNIKFTFLKLKQISSDNIVKIKKQRKSDPESHYHHKLLTNSFARLKINFSLNSRKKYIQYNNSVNSKIDFFRKLKLISIEGLLTQGVIEKIKNFSKRFLLSSLLITSFSKIKLRHYQTKKEFTQKAKIFDCLRNYKSKNQTIFSNTIRFFLRKFFSTLFQNKISHQRKKLKELNNEIKFEKKLFFYRIRNNYLVYRKLVNNLKDKFKTKSIKSTLKKIKKYKSKKKNNLLSLEEEQNISRKETQNLIMNDSKSMSIELSKSYFYTIFFKKTFFRIMKKKGKKINTWKLHVKKFLKHINSRITINALKIFKTNMIKTKNFRNFIKNTYKIIDQKYITQELKNISNRLTIKSGLNSMTQCLNNKHLEKQIAVYSSIQMKRKIFKSLKTNYVNKIKHAMLGDRYRDYLIITNLKMMTNLILNKNKKHN